MCRSILGTVEHPFTRRDDVFHPVPVERRLERSLCSIPLLVGTEPVLRARRQLASRDDAEAVVQEPDEVDHAVDLVLDLVLGDEHVGVVLGDVLDPEEPV